MVKKHIKALKASIKFLEQKDSVKSHAEYRIIRKEYFDSFGGETPLSIKYWNKICNGQLTVAGAKKKLEKLLKKSKKKKKQKIALMKGDKIVQTFATLGDCAKALHIHPQTARNYLVGKTKNPIYELKYLTEVKSK